MQSFSTILLINTLHGLLDELEHNSALDPHNFALVQFKDTLNQQIARLEASQIPTHQGSDRVL